MFGDLPYFYARHPPWTSLEVFGSPPRIFHLSDKCANWLNYRSTQKKLSYLFANFLFVVTLCHFRTRISYQALLRFVPTFNASSSLSLHSFHSLGMTSITLLSEINSVRDKLMSCPDCFLPAVPWESPGWKTPEVRSSSRPEDPLPAGSFLNRAESCQSGGLLCDLGKSCRSESSLSVL